MASPRTFNHRISNSLWHWLFPVTYLLHIIEECYGGGGYSAYLERLRSIHVSPTSFLVAQGIGLALMVAGVLLARRLKFSNQFSAILGTAVLVNSVTHTVQTLVHGEYVPGLITAVLIWLPLGVATLLRFRNSMSSGRLWLCIVCGLGINAVVELLIIVSDTNQMLVLLDPGSGSVSLKMSDKL
ncbi:MAG: HXXEE domain-containing protein [Pyrinomonadaceae bacterium]